MRRSYIALGASVLALAAPATASAGGSSGSSGGAGQAQDNYQAAATIQIALAQSQAHQNAVNGNAPVNVAGYDVDGGSSSANQVALNASDAAAYNDANTSQSSSQSQGASSSYGDGAGGSGQYQANAQGALTAQLAAASSHAKQNAVNGNSGANIAG